MLVTSSRWIQAIRQITPRNARILSFDPKSSRPEDFSWQTLLGNGLKLVEALYHDRVKQNVRTQQSVPCPGDGCLARLPGDLQNERLLKCSLGIVHRVIFDPSSFVATHSAVLFSNRYFTHEQDITSMSDKFRSLTSTRPCGE